MPRVPLHTRIAPHVVVLTVAFSLVGWGGITGIPRQAGETLYSGPLENGTAVPFTAEAGDNVVFRLKAEYPESRKGAQYSNLTIRDEDGTEVWRAYSGFIVIRASSSQSAEQGVVTPALPSFRPNETADYTLTWVIDGGTESVNSIKILANGFTVIRQRAEGAMLLMMTAVALGVFGVVGTRTERDVATGKGRFWPVKGMTSASAITAMLAGFALGAALILWVGGKFG